MSIFSEICEVSDAKIESWLKEVIDDGVGYLKVSNSGGAWIIYDDGLFHMKFRGKTKELYKTKETAKEIFRKRISKYMNVEHSGYRYYYDKGKWKRSKVTFAYD